MLITRRSMLSGKVHTFDIPITENQYFAYRSSPSALVQDAFPSLTADQREFILTGSTPEEWDAAFKEPIPEEK